LAVVGLPGSTFKEEWVALFAHTERIYLGLDPGEQYDRDVERVVNLLGTQRTYLVDWPEKPDDLVRARGADAAYDCIAKARPLDMPPAVREGDIFRFDFERHRFSVAVSRCEERGLERPGLLKIPVQDQGFQSSRAPRVF
jgi:hypothetical protein